MKLVWRRESCQTSEVGGGRCGCRTQWQEQGQRRGRRGGSGRRKCGQLSTGIVLRVRDVQSRSEVRAAIYMGQQRGRLLAGKASRSLHASATSSVVTTLYSTISTAMASIRLPSASFLDAFLPVVRARLLPQEDATQRLPLVQQIQQLRLKASLIPAALAPIPTILGELWDGILKAVPKKKTSHMKKRHRQMAGKALKDVTALNKCSACGRLKRAHILCPYCVQSMCESLRQLEMALT